MFFKRVEIFYKAFGEKSETTLEYGGYEIALEGENVTLSFEGEQEETFPVRFLKEMFEGHEVSKKKEVLTWDGEPVAFFHGDIYNEMSNGEFRHIFADMGKEK